MIFDLLKDKPTPHHHADVCIIGAGAAGIVLAVELVRQGKRVLLLEGGGPQIEAPSQDPYRSTVVGNNFTGIHSGRFRAHGGTTTRWGGQILELDDQDFQKRSWIEGSGWPIEKNSLTPYYNRALTMEGLGRSIHDDQGVWQQIGLEQPGFRNFDTFLSRWCPEPNFSRLHAPLLSSSACVQVWLHSNAVAPVIEGARIRGVQCRTLTGIEHTFHADNYVWCMGGIESSRFFLQPELAQMPWNRSGLLGRHFQDHLTVSAASIRLLRPKQFHRDFDNIFARRFKYQPKLRLHRHHQEQHKTLNVAAKILYASDAEGIGGDLKDTAKKLLRGKFRETTSGEVLRLTRNSPLLARQSWHYAVRHRGYIQSHADVQLCIHCEQDPEGKSSLSLTGERDALGMLRTRVDWHVSDRELHTIATFVDFAADSLRDIAQVTVDPNLRNDPDEFRKKCLDSYHHMGGMRMAASPDHGVVDLDLRLHGMDNGYICSGAVFPCSGFSNPTHTVIALAIRLADHLGK